jgi:hypothetical protein
MVNFREKVSGLNASHISIGQEGTAAASGVTKTVVEKGVYNEATGTWSQNWSHGQLWQYEVSLIYDPAIVNALQIRVWTDDNLDFAGTADLDGVPIPHPLHAGYNPLSGIYRFNPRVLSITRVDANPTEASALTTSANGEPAAPKVAISRLRSTSPSPESPPQILHLSAVRLPIGQRCRQRMVPSFRHRLLAENRPTMEEMARNGMCR